MFDLCMTLSAKCYHFLLLCLTKNVKKGAEKQGGNIYKKIIISSSNLSKIGQFVIAGIDRCHFLLLS